MKIKAYIKRIAALALSLIVMVGLMPMTALASSTSVCGAEGHILDNVYTGTFTNGYDSTIFIYATPGACELPYTTYSIAGSGGNFGVPKYDRDQWYFAGWRTWYKGSHSGAGVINSDKSNPEYDDKYNYFNPNADNGALLGTYPQGYMTVLKEYFWDGTYYLSAIFEPLVTVNVGEGVTYTVPQASMRAENKYSTKYNNGMTIHVDDPYVIAGVTANYGTNYSISESSVTVNSITKPTTVNVNTRLKQHKVHFNANGGTGTMDAQVFEYGVRQELAPNSFTREGYEFAGWRTTADESGDYHYDREMFVFTPENDGETSTLYAIWRPKQYTVSYQADGEIVFTEMVIHGRDAILPDVPKKEGFVGKWDSDGKNITADTTITAVYTSNTCTVNFDANGGEPVDPIRVTFGQKYGNLPSSAITGLSGGDQNWYLIDENGTVTDTNIKKLTVVSVVGDHTLFVKRSVLAPSVSIGRTVPGGISDDYPYYIPGASERVLTATVGNRNTDVLDYTYQWYKDGTLIEGATSDVLTLDGNVSDSGTYKVEVTAALKDGTNIVVTANSATGSKEEKVKILHAANTLNYDANGGEGGPKSSYTGGTSLDVSTDKPAREHYDFVDWNTAPDGTGEGYKAEDVYTFANDGGNGGCVVTLYAQWKLKEYTVTYWADGQPVSTEKVAYGKDATRPTVPAKEGFVGKWDSDGKNITGDTTIRVVYTEIPVVKPDEVKPEDKTSLEDTKAKLEEELKDDAYTEEDKKKIQDAIDDIDEALAELNKPADPNTPATGDNSNLWLWLALLILSGAGIFGIALNDRKRKAASRR